MEGRNPQALFAEGLARQGHVAPAVEACFEALRYDERDPLVHAVLAHLFLTGDFYDEAIVSASRAIELDPECAPAYLALGLAYDRRGGLWDQSILVWHELAEVRPELVVAHVQLGEALSAAAFPDEAIDAWRTALELDPRESRAMYDLAVAALMREGVATALPGFRRAGELDPSQDDFFFSLAGMRDDGVPAPDPETVADGSERCALSAAYALAFEEQYFSAAELIRAILSERLAGRRGARARGLPLPEAGGGQRGHGGGAAVADALDQDADCRLRARRVVRATPGAEPERRARLQRTRQGGTRPPDAAGACSASRCCRCSVSARRRRRTSARSNSIRRACGHGSVWPLRCSREGEHALAQWEIRRAAYHDTRRQGLFWRLYDEYAEGRSS